MKENSHFYSGSVLSQSLALLRSLDHALPYLGQDTLPEPTSCHSHRWCLSHQLPMKSVARCHWATRPLPLQSQFHHRHEYFDSSNVDLMRFQAGCFFAHPKPKIVSEYTWNKTVPKEEMILHYWLRFFLFSGTLKLIWIRHLQERSSEEVPLQVASQFCPADSSCLPSKKKIEGKNSASERQPLLFQLHQRYPNVAHARSNASSFERHHKTKGNLCQYVSFGVIQHPKNPNPKII